MSQAGGSGSGDVRYVSKSVSREVTPPEPAPQSAALLESVLHATLTVCASDEPLDPSDVQRLRDVARRHAGCGAVTEPIAVELVRAVLEGHFLSEDDSQGVGPAAVVQIAQSLLDDPVSKARLQRFWERLTGETS